MTKVQPISYPKANVDQLLTGLAIYHGPLEITQSSEAAAEMQDVSSFEKNLYTMALLKILALGNAQIENGKATSAAKAFAQICRGNKAAI
jgi:hypothetical protein